MCIDTGAHVAPSPYLRDAGEELVERLEALTGPHRHEVLLDLAEALLHHQATGDGSRLARVVTSLSVSASLRERPDFRAALEAAESASWDGPSVEIADYLSELRGRRPRS